MPFSLADGRKKVIVLTSKPADLKAPTLAELNAGKDISCHILSGDFSLGATASETIDEKPLCVEGNVSVPGASNYSGNVSIFRSFDENGLPEEEDGGELGDYTFQLHKVKGTRLHYYVRETSKKSREELAEGDPLEYFEVLTDNPTAPESSTGYIKRTVPLLVQDAELDAAVAA